MPNEKIIKSSLLSSGELVGSALTATTKLSQKSILGNSKHQIHNSSKSDLRDEDVKKTKSLKSSSSLKQKDEGEKPSFTNILFKLGKDEKLYQKDEEMEKAKKSITELIKLGSKNNASKSSLEKDKSVESFSKLSFSNEDRKSSRRNSIGEFKNENNQILFNLAASLNLSKEPEPRISINAPRCSVPNLQLGIKRNAKSNTLKSNMLPMKLRQMTVKTLLGKLQDEPNLCESEKVLLFDFRQFNEFEASHVIGSHNVTIPGLIFDRIQKGSTEKFNFEKWIPSNEGKKDWKERGTKSVILYESDMPYKEDDWKKTQHLSPVTMVAALLEKEISEDIFWLEGGYNFFAEIAYNSKYIITKAYNPPETEMKSPLSAAPSCPSLEPKEFDCSIIFPWLLLGSDISVLTSDYKNTESEPLSIDVKSPDFNTRAKDFPSRVESNEKLTTLSIRLSLLETENNIKNNNISSILNVAKDCTDLGLYLNMFSTPLKSYKKLGIDDSPDTDIEKEVLSAIEYIENYRINNPNDVLLVHCKAGRSRSAMIVVAYLMKYHNLNYNDAYSFVKSKREIIDPNIGFTQLLRKLDKLWYPKNT